MRDWSDVQSASSSAIGLPDGLDGGPPQADRGGRVPEPDEARLVDEDDAVVDVLERLGRVRALLRLGEEARVVERERDPARELRRHLEVGLVEARLRRRSCRG